MPGESSDIPRHLRTDLHLHSTFTDGKADVATLAAEAAQKGFEIAISDHYSAPYGMQGEITLARYLDELGRHAVYRSVEVDLGREQDIAPVQRSRLDYCITSLHMVLDDDGDRILPDRYSATAMRHFMECATRQYERGLHASCASVVGHPTFLQDLPRAGQDELWTPELRRRVIAAAVETGIALELSTRYSVPTETFVREALAAGARFAVGSDGHRLEALGVIDYARRLSANLEIPEDRFFLPARRLQ